MNPLRFPGGKHGFAPHLVKILRQSGIQVRTIAEPYGGSMSVSLHLINEGVAREAAVTELDPLLYSFWRTVKEDPEYLVERINTCEVNIENWHKMRCFIHSEISDHNFREAGFAYLFLNRTCFSGIVTGGPIGGYQQNSKYKLDCRFYRSTISARIREVALRMERVNILNGDAIELIRFRKGEGDFLYVDPPYYGAGNRLYRCYYVVEEHLRLRDELALASIPWALSYDDRPEIVEMYSNFHCYRVYFRYSARQKVTRSELLISNVELNIDESHVTLSGFCPTRDRLAQ